MPWEKTYQKDSTIKNDAHTQLNEYFDKFISIPLPMLESGFGLSCYHTRRMYSRLPQEPAAAEGE